MKVYPYSMDVLVAVLALGELGNSATDEDMEKVSKYDNELEVLCNRADERELPTTSEIVDYICEVFEKNLKGKQ